ncbi:MAG: lysophospholipid acyltransferase family protein [Oscillospiraceae bacterium]
MRTIIWFIYFWGYLVALIPQLLKAKKYEKNGEFDKSHAIVEKEAPKWAKSLLKLAGAEVTVIGTENLPHTPAVFVANHQGNFDIPILLSCLDRPNGLIAKVELKKLPIIRDWMELLGCVFIDRDNPRQSLGALNDAGKNLVDSGRSFIIFPEGTRSRGDEIGEFKSGAFRIATKVGAPIVPIAMDGSYRLMEQNKMWITPAKVTVRILPQIDTAGKSREEIKTLAQEVRQVIIDAKG